MSNIWDGGWSGTPSANTTVDGIGINTGMSPANVDNAFRAIMAYVAGSFAASLKDFFFGIAPLPIANGGTAATTAPTALTALGGLPVAYRDLPRVDKSSNFTFSSDERAYGLWCNGSSLVATIDPEATTPIISGAVYALMNGGSSAVSLVSGSGVSLYVNGAVSTSNATLAPGAVSTVIKWGPDYWTINGSGVS